MSKKSHSSSNPKVITVFERDAYQEINSINFTGLIVKDISVGSVCENGISDTWSKFHNVIKGVILSFDERVIKDLNFCEMQYFVYIVG